MIDDIDREIIRQLQIDGRMAYAQLAQHVGLSAAAVRQRVNRLTAEEVIDIVAVTDPVKIGLGYQAMLGVSVVADAREMANRVAEISDAVYVVMTAGRFDLVVELVCRDSDIFVSLLNQIRGMEGIQTVETIPYLGIVKQSYDWGVG